MGEDLKNRIRYFQYISQSFLLYVFWIGDILLGSLTAVWKCGDFRGGTLEMDIMILLYYFLEQTWPFLFSSSIACRKTLAIHGFYIACKMSLIFHPKPYMVGCDCLTLLYLLLAHALTALTRLLWLINIIIHSTVAARDSNDTLGPCYSKPSRNS